MRAGTTLAISVWCWLGLVPIRAQHDSHLYGRILDPSGAGIAAASVTIVDEDTGFRRTAETEITGDYAVSSLQPGAYKITVRKEGFRTVVRFGVKLALNASARVDFALPVGSMQETVTVQGDAPLVERADASTGGQFAIDEIQRLPLNGRGLLTLLEFVPGVSVTPATRGEPGQFTTSGQRPNTNSFVVDGVSANTGVAAGGIPAQSTGGALPALSAFGSMDTIISLEAVRELRVQTSASVAEYGRLPGAVLSFTSRSGTNEWHGSTALRLRHEQFASNDWFANQAAFQRTRQRLFDFSPALGGPLVRNRSFLFLSYQRVSLRQPYTWMQPVPTVAAREGADPWIQSVLTLFPAPNGSPLAPGAALWTGAVTRPAGLDAGGVRFDQSITSRLSFFGRYSDSASRNQFGPVQVNRLDLRNQSLTLGFSARLSSNLLLDGRVNESQAGANSIWTGSRPSPAAGCELLPLTSYLLGAKASCDYLVRFTIGGVGQLVSGPEGSRRQRQFQVIQSGVWNRGTHSLAIGADYRRIRAIRRDRASTLGIIADDLSSISDRFKLWISNSDAVNRSAPVEELSLWAQDTWQVHPRLTLSLGLRWEYSPAPNDAFYFLDRSTETVFNTKGPLWPSKLDNLAPRAGIAWRLSRDGRTVLRAGGGLYFDSSLSIATDVINGGPLSVSEFRNNRDGLFSMLLSFGFLPDLRLPRVTQWNLSLEHAFPKHDLLSVAYVGSAGHSLIRRETGGLGSSPRSWLALTTNHGNSDYQALHVQYRRPVARGLQVSTSYAWSHSLDNDSSDAFLVWAGPGTSLRADRGSSDFDLRHSFTASLSYELRGWALDGVFRARSGFPLNVFQDEQYLGIAFNNAFRPDWLGSAPAWVDDPAAPGGRRLNPSAFSGTPSGIQGSLGRNVLTGFGMSQFDLALRREFRLADHRSLQFRVEAYNAFNHPNFADPIKFLESPLFGRSPSMLNLMLGTGSPGSGISPILQTGGPRSLQFSLRLRF